MATPSTILPGAHEEKTINDFPLPTRQAIVNSGYPEWYKKYRGITGKARVIPLTTEFLDYLKADGIILPPDTPVVSISDRDSGVFSVTNTEDSDGDDDDDDDGENPAQNFPEVHAAIIAAIAELGGAVYPKLNWSAPKDAAFMLGNTLKCSSPSDVYLLLKSSNFITHDLEHVFDETVDTPDETGKLLQLSDVEYALVLRKWVDVITSVEFRCFVKQRKIVAITQRDLNHYDFLENGKEEFLALIQEFFARHLEKTFPEADFIFDVYIPKTLLTESRVWLVDINPYSPKTDTLTFAWQEILNIDPSVPDFKPNFRLIKKNDPEAYGFAQPYSAHKLPRDVVDAAAGGAESMLQFKNDWKHIVEGLGATGIDDSSDDEEDEDENGSSGQKKGDGIGKTNDGRVTG
ncbi:hypothetical protein TWF106_002688 [Orbilia oligospora]|uniref:Uncharacterized protein n=1 Tax=Orbilia oligospora TaxID=2813651 RepID=A0A7C8Q8A7_ORBOL|nr:hypothetical protein TWF106_002688 [Orbilia oligospora]